MDNWAAQYKWNGVRKKLREREPVGENTTYRRIFKEQ